MMYEIVEENNNKIHTAEFCKVLIDWGKDNFRSFPWRFTENPFFILIAEIMLHRTQATQVVPFYKKFIKKYPSIHTLAKAEIEELTKQLFSLGLHWRIKLIHKMAAELESNFNGAIPQKKQDLVSLSGVSDYIANAVRCFAWNIREPLIDTNTVRVIGRLFLLEIKDSSRRNKKYKNLIAALVDPVNPRAYNYSLLDLADQICSKKRDPNCKKCPINKWCLYYKSSDGQN